MGPKPNMTTTTTPTTTTFLEGACQCYNVHFLVHGFNQEKEGLSSSSSSSSSSNFFIQDGPFSGYPLPLVHESLHIVVYFFLTKKEEKRIFPLLLLFSFHSYFFSFFDRVEVK
ncbi:hypothetical protein HMI54_010902 [Coelomomyces lativittatus]|nr:hypothetical protein HMI54_010902 [Coelomomyces lativittatus]